MVYARPTRASKIEYNYIGGLLHWWGFAQEHICMEGKNTV
jgi:hypothetical protein